jgi:hypothetical protein
MLTKPGYRKAAALAAVVILAVAAKAQETGAPCTLGLRSYSGFGVSSQTGAPYTATIKTSFEQRLPDGNTIRGFTITHQARDSAGRTRSEMPRECYAGDDGLPHLQMNVSVSDPTAKSYLSWEVGVFMNKTAHLSHVIETPQRKMTPEEIEEQKKYSMRNRISHGVSKHERLESKMIAGVMANGSRITRTIPTGEEGNELPLTTMSETWGSKELNLELLEINDDPRTGKRTTEVIELIRGEPDPALFAPPAGYTIEEQKVTNTLVAPAQ